MIVNLLQQVVWIEVYLYGKLIGLNNNNKYNNKQIMNLVNMILILKIYI